MIHFQIVATWLARSKNAARRTSRRPRRFGEVDDSAKCRCHVGAIVSIVKAAEVFAGCEVYFGSGPVSVGLSASGTSSRRRFGWNSASSAAWRSRVASKPFVMRSETLGSDLDSARLVNEACRNNFWIVFPWQRLELNWSVNYSRSPAHPAHFPLTLISRSLTQLSKK